MEKRRGSWKGGGGEGRLLGLKCNVRSSFAFFRSSEEDSRQGRVAQWGPSSTSDLLPFAAV